MTLHCNVLTIKGICKRELPRRVGMQHNKRMKKSSTQFLNPGWKQGSPAPPRTQHGWPGWTAAAFHHLFQLGSPGEGKGQIKPIPLSNVSNCPPCPSCPSVHRPAWSGQRWLAPLPTGFGGCSPLSGRGRRTSLRFLFCYQPVRKSLTCVFIFGGKKKISGNSKTVCVQ